MENKQFYIKFLTNQPIKVETHIDTQRKRREFPLTDVGDLIGAFQARPGSLLANTDSGLITLHLPEGVAKDSLAEDCFATDDESDTTLDPGCLLSDLVDLGSKSKRPLIIKSRNGLDSGSSNMLQSVERVCEAVHRRISELREPTSERMSQCSNNKFSQISNYFGFTFVEFSWDLSVSMEGEAFDWNYRGESEAFSDILSYFTTSVPIYQFKDARNVDVTILYNVHNISVRANGKLDIAVFLPNVLATMPETIFCQCIAVIEVKTPSAISRNRPMCINQVRLQVIALSSGGNAHRPFGLLTNMTDYWHFMWITEANQINSAIFDNSQQGICALEKALPMMNGESSSCPFTNRAYVSLPETRGGGGYTDDVANMEEFYDQMTEEEVLRHKSQIGLARIFETMNPSLQQYFTVD